jgi:excisionase family DNA binding protein
LNKSYELLSLPRMAREIGLGESTVRRWVADGKLPVVVLPSGQMKVRRTDLDGLLQPHVRTSADVALLAPEIRTKKKRRRLRAGRAERVLASA